VMRVSPAGVPSLAALLRFTPQDWDRSAGGAPATPPVTVQQEVRLRLLRRAA